MNKLSLYIVLLSLAVGLASCESATTPPASVRDTTIVTSNDHALFVLNEGVYLQTNSSLDVFIFHKTMAIHDSGSRSDTTIVADSLTHAHRDVLTGMGEGNDMLIRGNQAYVLDNSKNSIYVVNADSLVKTTTIRIGVDQPNKMALAGANQLIVTRRGVTSAAIIDLTSNQIVDSLPLGEPSVAIAVLNNKAYITSGSAASHLTVFDLSNHHILHNYPLANAPEQALADSANNRVVIGTIYTAATQQFLFVDAATDKITDSLSVGTPADDIELTLGGKVFIINGTTVTSIAPSAHIPGTQIISGKSMYYKGVYSRADDELYLGVNDFTSPTGRVDVFDATTGALKRSLTTGIAPAHFAFYH